jgi:hypothetical protein
MSCESLVLTLLKNKTDTTTTQKTQKLKLQDILSQDDDELLNELLREQIQKVEEEKEKDTLELLTPRPSSPSNEIDQLIPEAPNVNKVLALKPVSIQKPKKAEWVQVIDVNQDFPDFHSLVPSLALDVSRLLSVH